MNMLSTLSRLLIPTLLLGALLPVTALTYDLSAQATETTASRPINLDMSERRDEAARLALMNAIAEQYGITMADRTAHWSLDEVHGIQSSLKRIADRLSELTSFDGQRVMQRLFQGVSFYRDREWRGNIAYTIGGTVSFYDAWARYDHVGRTFYLAHELGHVLDAQDSPLHLFLGEVSNTFARNVAAYSDAQGVYHLGRTYPLRDPRDRPRHRTDNASEDWAESFATVVVPAFEAELRDLGEARAQEVRRVITRWVERTLGDHETRSVGSYNGLR